MLRHRFLSALVLVPLVCGLAYLGGYWWLGFIALVAVIASRELTDLLQRGGYPPHGWVLLAWTLALIASGFWPRWFPLSLVLLAGLIASLTVSLLEVAVCGRLQNPTLSWTWTTAGALYLGLSLAAFVALRRQPNGLAWLMTKLLTTWITDTGAYFIGKFYGRTKLAPRLSPGKTVEGSVAGLVSAVLLAVIFGLVIKLPPQHALALGLIFGVMTQVGDLSESAVKRELQIKDFGNLIPGHGGILDRFDSLLFTGPVVYYYAAFLLKEWLG